MTRELKFRAWDKYRHVMLYKSFWDRNWYSEDDKCVCGLMPNDRNSFELMQYTGLKDTNGVEIYKDDILQDGDNRLYRVEFITGCFCLKDKWGSTKPLYEANDACKRIGNIHENPEMNKQK